MQSLTALHQSNKMCIINYLKQHYTYICKLCALGNVTYLPAVDQQCFSHDSLNTTLNQLEEKLNHIKKQLHHLMAESLNDTDVSIINKISQTTELHESLSNYRHELETLLLGLK